MIRAYASLDGRLDPIDPAAQDLSAAVWIDLFDPSPEEVARVEAALGVALPSREAMSEIEVSSRFDVEGDARLMTVTLPANVLDGKPTFAPVTFVLSEHRLVSLRHHEPSPFRTLVERATRRSLGCVDGETVLLALLETIVDRIADVLEHLRRAIDAIGHEIFHAPDEARLRSVGLLRLVERIGRASTLASDVRETLAALGLLLGYAVRAAGDGPDAKPRRRRVEVLRADVEALLDYNEAHSEKTAFLLDATLGLINIEQNGIIKIFSVVAVVFMPPTLVASVYGMNFAGMPELEWTLGYPFAIVLMVVVAILPYLFFRIRGWL